MRSIGLGMCALVMALACGNNGGGGTSGEAAPAAPRSAIELAAIGVLGQCLLYQFAYPTLGRVQPGLPHGKALCRAVSRHVAGMTLAGLAALGKSPAE